MASIKSKVFMKNNVRIPEIFLAILIVVYAMLYEWRSIFELNFFLPIVNLLKCVIPFFLLLFILRFDQIPKYQPSRQYIKFFLLFMVWGFFSSLFSFVPKESLIQWLKFIPVLFFCWFICLYLLDHEEVQKKIMKFFVAIAVFTVIQYVFLEIATFSGVAKSFNLPTHRGGLYYGPFGLLGQGSGNVYFKSLGFSLWRIYGFWLEPSTVAGFLLAAAFFSVALYLETKRKIWKMVASACFIGGICTFSNTAYLCIGIAGLIGELFFLKERKNKKAFHLAAALFFILLIFYSILGRWFVAKYFSNNIDLRYISGVRDAIHEPYGGRKEQLSLNLKTVFDGADYELAVASDNKPAVAYDTKRITKIAKNILFGIGFRISGTDAQRRGFPIASASALILWLAYTGVIGFMILLMREFQIVSVIFKNIYSSHFLLCIFQAWTVMFVTNLSYGTLMNPFYLITVAFVFSSVYRFRLRGSIG